MFTMMLQFNMPRAFDFLFVYLFLCIYCSYVYLALKVWFWLEPVFHFLLRKRGTCEYAVAFS